MARSRSRGRDEDGYQSDDATVRPFKKVKKSKSSKGTKTPKKPPPLYYQEGEEVMARWPGSRLYYNATIQLRRPEQGEYDVLYENGVVFTVTPKDVYKQPSPGSKKQSRKASSDMASDAAEITEDEDITSMIVNAAVKATKRVSSHSFKEPSRVSSRAARSSRAGNGNPDLFSDDEELLSVSQRPSVSSKVSNSSRSSRLNRVSFSSTINRLLDNVLSNRQNGTKEDLTEAAAAEELAANGVEEVTEEKEETKKVSKSSRVSSTKNASFRLEQFSEDEEEGKPLVPQPAQEPAQTQRLSSEWLVSLFFMFLCPTILITLHNLCTSNVTNLSCCNSGISFNPADYFDKEALAIVLGFISFLRFCEFVCIGKMVEGYRMNGFQTLLICLLAVPVCIFHEISLKFVTEKYFYLMTSCIFFSFLLSLVSYFTSLKCPEDQLSTKGNTGNPVTDFYHGRQTNPVLTGCNLKLQSFRFSMIVLALLNVALVLQSTIENKGNVNLGVMVSASFQVLYAMDAMFHEEYYFNSVDYLSSGFGWCLISSYLTFPFLPTLITRYMVYLQPRVSMVTIILAGVLNMLGYMIYRSAENQRCELARNPANPDLAHLNTIEGSQGKRLIVGGWWSVVRHPNYLGEILIQWSWVLPLWFSIGFQFWTPYYLPAVTTIMLLLRCEQTNSKNKRKYGQGWDDYSRKVKANLIPYVY